MAYKKITKAQLDYLKTQQDIKTVNASLITQYEEMESLGKKLKPHQAKRLKELKKENILKTESVSLEKLLIKQAKSLDPLKKKSASLAKTQLDMLKSENKAAKDGGKAYQNQVAVVEQIASGQASSKDIQAAINDLGADASESMKAYLKTQKKSAETAEFSKNAMSEMDGVIGGMGGTIKNFLLNPFTILTGLLLAFNKQQEVIADQFGAMGMTRFKGEIDASNVSMQQLGFSLEESVKTTSDLANGFGLSVGEAAKLAPMVGESAKALGMSLDEATKLYGVFTTMGGLSAQQTKELAAQAQSLAEANDVAPNEILQDVANNTELFAKYAKNGGANVLRASIQAKKLGIELSDVAGAMEGMLDFSSSLNAEVEASVMLGRDLNLQKARELSLAGDIEGFQTEILKQVGSQAQFDKMNILQKKALAAATGMGVEQLSKMVSKEKEAVSLAGELSKQNIGDLTSQESITKTAELMNTLKALGVELSAKLGPSIDVIVGGISGFVKKLDDLKILMPTIIGFVGLLTAKTLLNTSATIAQSIATLKGVGAKKLEAVQTLTLTTNKAGETVATLSSTAAKTAENATTKRGLMAKIKEASIIAYTTTLTAASTVARVAKTAADNIGLTTLAALIVSGAMYGVTLVSQTVGLLASTAATIANTAVKGASAIASYAAAAGSMVLAAATFMAGAAAGSLASLGFGAPVLIGMAIAGIAAMVGGVMMARNAGDMMSPAKGKTQISTKEGELFNMSKNDDILAGPGLSGAMGGGGSVTNVDTSGIERGTQQTVAAVNTLVEKFESAFGFGGSAAKQIGNRVGTNVNESRR